jgi:hypothetical protein
MFYESFRKLVFPTVLLTVVGAVWVVAWSKELQTEVDRNSWPALPLPPALRAELNKNAAAEAAIPPPKPQSLQKVFLKNDQVVGVR